MKIARWLWVNAGLFFLLQGSEVAADSPFARPSTAPAKVTAPSDARIRLDQLEFTGLFSVGGETTFSLYDKKNDVNLWLPEKGTELGFSVNSFDSEKGELRINYGDESRLISLNRNTIAQIKGVPQPVVTKSGKKIVPKDPETLKKEEDARLLVTDLLEIGMQERERYRAERAKRLQDIRARQAAQARTRDNK